MRDLGIKNSSLAKLVSTTPGEIYHYQSGRRTPTLARLRKLAWALECRIDQLLSAKYKGGKK